MQLLEQVFNENLGIDSDLSSIKSYLPFALLKKYLSEFSKTNSEFLTAPIEIDIKKNSDQEMAIVIGGHEPQLLVQVTNMDFKDVLVIVTNPEKFLAVISSPTAREIYSNPKLHFIFDVSESRFDGQIHSFVLADNARLARLYGALWISTLLDSELEFNEWKVKIENAFSKSYENLKKIDSMMMEDCFRGFVNTSRNFPEYYAYPHWDLLKNKITGIPALIVGTAPSLNHSLDIINKRKNEFIICAVDTSVKILLDHGITPDFVVCVERIATENLFKNLQGLENTILIASSLVQSETLKNFPGPKIGYWRNVGYDSWFEKIVPDKKQNIGLNVGHLGFCALRHFGVEDIFLIGHDYSYAPGTEECYSNKADINLLGMGAAEADALIMKKEVVVGAYGNLLTTTEFWLDCASMMGDFLLKCGGNLTQVLPQEFGLSVHGAQVITPESFENYKSNYISKRIIRELLMNLPLKDPSFEYAKKNMIELRAYLNFCNHLSIATIDKISKFWLDHDASQLHVGYQKLYDDLLRELTTIQQKIISTQNNLFERSLMSFLCYNHSVLGIRLAHVFYHEKNFTRRVNTQISLMMDWFQLIQIWSVRTLYFLETMNQEKWRFW